MSTSALIIITSIAVVTLLLLYAIRKMRAVSPTAISQLEAPCGMVVVRYSSPRKRGRKVFGHLVPFGEVWRTGANESTTIESSCPMVVGGTTLPAGRYALFTIPGEDKWTIIFNSRIAWWGAKLNSKAPHNPAFDAVRIEVPAETLPETTEELSIELHNEPEPQLTLNWDRTRVTVPINR
ncbi:MAG: DUF2911 domain-containing protein [Cryomorphaceae bacterium]|nr:MAG: DUF2911 domain-containing protein [Cryomorphaceae bacterium]